MPLSFDTKTLTIGELFSGANVFRMPIFQRPFSWEEETALELFGDIHQAMERAQEVEGGGYFLGPIIVAQSGPSSPLEVVDGQQRLVTLSAMFAILRDLLPDGAIRAELQDCMRRPERALRGLPEEPRVRLRPADHEQFEAWVQRPGGTRALPDDSPTDASDRLLAVIEAIKADIGRVDTAYVGRLARYILNDCYVVRIKARTLDDAYVLFRSLNSRGLPLNELDIVRAELVGANYDPQLASSSAECWDSIQAEIGHNEFLTYVRTVISLIRPQALDTDLRAVLRELLKDPSAAVNFRRYLATFLRSYVALDTGTLDFGPNSAEINRVVSCLKGLPFDDWRSPALVWLAQQPSAREALEFLKLLEGLALGLYILGKTKLQTAKRFKEVNKEALMRTALTTRGALHLTDAEIVKLRELLESPIPARKKFLVICCSG